MADLEGSPHYSSVSAALKERCLTLKVKAQIGQQAIPIRALPLGAPPPSNPPQHTHLVDPGHSRYSTGRL